MKISRIMRTDMGPGRLEHSVRGSLLTSQLEPEAVNQDAIYEVTDEQNRKIGEIKGERLAYLAQSSVELNLEQIINAFDEGLVVIDASGRICYGNEAYSRIVGVPMSRIVCKNLYVIEKDALILRILQDGKPVTAEKQLVRSVNKYVSLRAFPIFQEGKIVGAFSIFRDVTELNQLNQEVERITGVAEEFSSRINHRAQLSNLQIVSRNPAYMNLISQAVTVAKTDASVLIRGENGVGKEIFTNLIHSSSLRREKPFITVNCAAIPETLIESELFGYEEGAFTGSKKGGKVGKFQLAHGGTLFLDEIGDMPLSMQAKLLRVLQEGEIEKLGRERNIPVDVRVIAATNQPLEKMILNKQFRSDLYYRLNVISLNIPPLRQRREDIMPLADHFLRRYNDKYQKNTVLSRQACDILEAYDWPGNVREMKNCIESCVVLCAGEEITPAQLPATIRLLAPPDAAHPAEINGEYGTLRDEVEAYERHLITKALETCGQNREQAARRLGISRRTLYRKLGLQAGDINGTWCHD